MNERDRKISQEALGGNFLIVKKDQKAEAYSFLLPVFEEGRRKTLSNCSHLVGVRKAKQSLSAQAPASWRHPWASELAKLDTSPP